MNKESRQARITPGQMILREGVRTLGHPLAFRATTEHVSPNGLKDAHDLLKRGTGVIVVEPHFSALDPMWIANGMTRRMGFRSRRMSGPIREDRVPKGFKTFAESIGFTLSLMVTPDALETLLRSKEVPIEDRKAMIAEFKEKREAYEQQSAKTLKEGGIVVVAYSGHREPVLKEPDKIGVLGNLIQSLEDQKETNYGVHFAAIEIPGVSDYATRRGYNLGTKYTVRHGNTFTREELLKISERSDNSNKDWVTKINQIAYHELHKIVPSTYLPKRP